MSIRKGDSIIAGMPNDVVNSKADVSLSNLDYLGKNISTWSTNVTNCITNIPQDIKLELNNGTLTLKAGSKVYVPNGAGVFDEVIITSDKSITPGGTNGKKLLFYYTNGLSGLVTTLTTDCYSGIGMLADDGMFYNTNANIIRYYYNDSPEPDVFSFPLAQITISGGVVISIDQVFNGFGYIGSTVFALPGVKGLIPNGRNLDGTLKNISFTTTSVKTINSGYNNSYECYGLSGSSINVSKAYYQQDSKPSSTGTMWYKPSENGMYRIANNGTVDTSSFAICVKTFRDSNEKITSFESYDTFHAVDYNEADFVVDFQRPTASNNYTWYRKYKSGWVEQGVHGNLKAASSYYSLASHVGMEIQTAFNLPIPLSQVAQANAEASGNAGVYCGDVYPINNGASVKCWIFNSNSDAIDASTITIFITVSGMAA